MRDSIDNVEYNNIESLDDNITIVDRIARDTIIEESKETTIA